MHLAYPRRRVVVIGNAGLDLRLAVPRLPLPGETLIGSDSARAPGGKGLNQAVVAARCGARVVFCAPLGNDEAQASEVERHLSLEGFDELILPRLPYATDFSLLMVLPGGENSIVSTSACSLALTIAEAEPALRAVGDGDVVLLQGDLSLEVTGYLLAAAREKKATTIFTPAPFWPGAEKLVSGCSLVIANRLEAEALGASIDRGRRRDRHARRRRLPLRRACLSGRERHRRRHDGLRRRVLRRDGRGVAQGIAIEQAIGAAQKAAALTATRAGAFEALPLREELRAILAG